MRTRRAGLDARAECDLQWICWPSGLIATTSFIEGREMGNSNPRASRSPIGASLTKIQRGADPRGRQRHDAAEHSRGDPRSSCRVQIKKRARGRWEAARSGKLAVGRSPSPGPGRTNGRLEKAVD